MSDDYFSNDHDSEYWDDVYYEEHKDEFGPGRGSLGIGRILILAFFTLLGIMCLFESPMCGLAILALVYAFRK